MLDFQRVSIPVAAFCVALLCASSGALAHGPPPGVLGILIEDDEGPTAIQLSEGVAVRMDDGVWRWLCPSLWDRPDTPVVGGSDARGVYVAATDDLVVVDPATAVVTALGAPDANGMRARGMVRAATDDDTVWLLANDPAEDVATALWQLGGDAPQRLTGLTENWYGVADPGDGRLAVVRPTLEGEIRIGFVPLDDVTAITEVVLDGPALGSPSLRTDGTDLYLALRVGLDQELWRVADDGSATLLATVVAGSILGPIRRADGALALVLDGVLSRLDPDTGSLEVIDDTQAWNCVQQRRGAPTGQGAVCVLQELYTLDDSGVGERLFAIEMLEPWYPDGLDEASLVACEVDWTDFAVDAGLIDPPPVDDVFEPVDVVEPVDADVAEPDTEVSDAEVTEDEPELQPDTTGFELEPDMPASDPADDGCGCRVTSDGSRPPAGWLLVTLAALLGWCRRRARVT